MSESREVATGPGGALAQRPQMAHPAHAFENRRALGPGAAQGAINIESERAIAEAQAAFVIANRNPRDEDWAYAKAMQAAKRPGLANQGLYSYKRGGQDVEGLSIRAAEELARIWGNFIYGMLELSQYEGSSEYQAFAHDLESNVRTVQNFTVNHVRDTKGGGKALTDQRDIYEIGANMGARRMRARILALLPAWLVDDFEIEIRKTRAAGDKAVPIQDILRSMLAKFAEVGVTKPMIEARLGHPLDQTQLAEVQTLRGVYAALKDSQTTIQDEFPTNAEDAGKPVVAGAEAEQRQTAPRQTKPKEEKPKDEKPKDQAKDPPKAETQQQQQKQDPPPADPPAQDPPPAEQAATAPQQAQEQAQDNSATAEPPPTEDASGATGEAQGDDLF